MADYTPYQKGIIHRYYEHRDTLALQKLQETISNLYLETSPTKIQRTWERVEKQLVAAGLNEKHAAALVKNRDLEELAVVVGELSSGSTPSPVSKKKKA